MDPSLEILLRAIVRLMLSGVSDATTMLGSTLDVDYYFRRERERMLQFLAQEAERTTSHRLTIREWSPRPILSSRIQLAALMICPLSADRPRGRVVRNICNGDVCYQVYLARNGGLELVKE